MSSACSLIRAYDHDSDASSLSSVSSSSPLSSPLLPLHQHNHNGLELAWYSAVSTYSKLTTTTDSVQNRLSALSDTAERFFNTLQLSSATPDYCAGLWSAFMPASLLWFVVYGKQRFQNGPSWSWASVDGGYIYWDAQWPRAEVPWPGLAPPDDPQPLRFPNIDSKLQVLQTRCPPSTPAFDSVSKRVIKLRCCICPVLPVADYHDETRDSRVLQGCIIDDPRVRKAVQRSPELSDLDWVATSLRVWEDRGRRNDHLKLLFDFSLSLDDFSARKYEVLYCVRFFEYAPSSVSWGHHDGLLLRRKTGTKNEYERVGLWKCTRSSMFDDKYQVIKLV